jgi:hypothetical protein
MYSIAEEENNIFDQNGPFSLLKLSNIVQNWQKQRAQA